MVGLPLLGLLGILRAGARLDAPRSFSGEWTITAESDAASADPCALWGGPLRLHVAQSGTRAELTLATADGSRALAGRIEGDRLTASGAVGIDGCARIQLALVPVDSGRIRAMRGALGGCAARECEATPIVVERDAPPPRRR